MTYEDFSRAGDHKLNQMANECFVKAYSGPHRERPILFLEAQFYIGEIDRREAEKQRREDRRIASRSHRMELAIIALILFEIVIGIVGIWLGFWEGKEQAAILERVEQAAMRAGNMNMLRH